MRATRSRLVINDRGYMFLEIVTAASMVMVMAVVAAPLYQALRSDRLAAASRVVISQLRLAQISAVKEGRFYRLATHASYPNSYRIEMSANNTTWPATTDTVASTQGAVPRVMTDWTSLASQYLEVSMPAPNTIPFDSRGAIANTGGDMSIGLAGPTGTRTVVVNHSGGIRIQ
jgi:Tfp pilus assembly protein FimT